MVSAKAPPPPLPARGGKTQDAVFSRGVSVGWHWEHLWLKGKRTGREMGGREGRGGRGHKPEAHKRFIVAVGSRWGGLEGPACSEQSASWLKQRPEAEVGGRSPEADRPTTRRRRRTEHLRACDAAVKSQSSKTEMLRSYS